MRNKTLLGDMNQYKLNLSLAKEHNSSMGVWETNPS